MVDFMITLFESTSSEFTTNGLGNLIDAISCSVTEERNGEYELKMEYPVSGRRYADLSLRRIILAKPNPYDDPQPFRIYGITKPIDGITTINAEHISYDMSGYPVAPFTAGTVVNAFQNMKAASAVPCPFTFMTDKSTTANITVSKPSSMRSIIGSMDGSILDVYGGEYEFNRYLVTLHNNRGSNRGVSIRYGKNLTDMQQEENCSSVYTGVYPFWYSKTDGLVQLSEKIVKAEGTYDFTRIYPLDLSQTLRDKPTEEQLRAEAQSYVTSNKIGIPKVSLTVSFVSLSQSEEYKDFAILETVHLCDTVNIYFPEMNVSATSKCIKTVYDVISGKYEKIELGDATSNLATTVFEQSQNISKIPTKTFMEQAIDNATKLISGGLGGYVLIHSSTGDGHPDEILIMDTDDISTATNVWRWNKNGFGYSSTGYNGEFGTAITMDGQIVANFIKSGIIDGSLLMAGSVESQSISQSYKTEVSNEIANEANAVEQAFVVADGQLRSEILSISESLSGDIESVETRVSSVIQTIDNLTFSFTDRYSGGKNNIQNSSGLNGMSGDWTYTGSVITEQSSEAVRNTASGSLFKLKAGTIAQEISVVQNQAYTLTFRAQRDTSNRCYASVVDGGTEVYIFDEYSTDGWNDYAYSFTTNSDSVVVKFGTTGEYFYVGDIMLAEGDVKQHWTPAPDEIYTNNVKIDKHGINITNSESSTETIIDNTQFAVKHNNDIVLTVNKDLTTLRKTDVTDELTIGKGKFVPATDGLDFVLLD